MSFQDDVAARTIYGEARGEGPAGMSAVAHVLLNRVKDGRWGSTLALVCMAPWQFSCWNTSDPNRAVLLALADDDAALRMCAAALDAAQRGEIDRTQGATHYYAATIVAPSWAGVSTFTVKIGRHLFYKNVP